MFVNIFIEIPLTLIKTDSNISKIPRNLKFLSKFSVNFFKIE